MVEKKIVEAVGGFTGTGGLGPKTSLSRLIEEAMAKAVMKCLKDGVSISDSETILAAKMAAREEVLGQY